MAEVHQLSCEARVIRGADNMADRLNNSSLAGESYTKTLQFLQDLGNCDYTGVYKDVMCEAEYGMLMAVLKHTNGNQSRSAQLLGITRTTLRQKLRHHQLL